MGVIETLILAFVGCFGYAFFTVLNIPTAALLGPLVAVMTLQLVGVKLPSLLPEINLLLQILLGIFLGSSISRQTLKELKTAFVPSLLMVVWTLVLTLGLGGVLIHSFDIDPATAFLSTAPAGLAETGMLAATVGANVGMVSMFQLSRFVVTLTIFPVILSFFNRRRKPETKPHTYFVQILHRASILLKGLSGVKRLRFTFSEVIPYLSTLTIGIIGGTAGIKLGMPAGAMMGAFLLTGGLSMAGVAMRQPPMEWRLLMQIGIGLNLGQNVSQNSMHALSEAVLPMILFTVFMFLTAFGMYLLLQHLTEWDDISCIIAVAPAGLTPMSMLAYEHSNYPLEVTLMHMARLITVKAAILPLVVLYLMGGAT